MTSLKRVSSLNVTLNADHSSGTTSEAFSVAPSQRGQRLVHAEGTQLSPQMNLRLQSRMNCQVSTSSSLCHHLKMSLTPLASPIPSCVGPNHALYTLLPKIHLSPDRPVSLFIKSVLLVSFSFCPLLFLPFELHSFPPIIHLSIPFFFTIPFYISILCPSFFVSLLLFPEAVPLLPASVVSEGWAKRCPSAIS